MSDQLVREIYRRGLGDLVAIPLCKRHKVSDALVKLVLLNMALYADETGTYRYPDREIAADLACSRLHFDRALAVLAEQGLIQDTGHAIDEEHGQLIPRLWRIHLPAAVAWRAEVTQ